MGSWSMDESSEAISMERYVQWNLSIMDTFETSHFVLSLEVEMY